MRSVVFKRPKSSSAEITIDSRALEFNIKILVEIELYGIRSFLGECSIVLLMLSNLLRLGVKETSGFKIKHLAGEVGCCDKVLNFVIAL